MGYSQFSNKTSAGYIPEPPERPGFWERMADRVRRVRMRFGLYIPPSNDPLAIVLFLQRNLFMRIYPLRVPESHLRFPGLWMFWPASLVFLIAAVLTRTQEALQDLGRIHVFAFLVLWVLRYLWGIRLFSKSQPVANGVIALSGILCGVAVFTGVHWQGYALLILMIAAKQLEKEALRAAAIGIHPPEPRDERSLNLGVVSVTAPSEHRDPSQTVFTWPGLMAREATVAAFALLIVLLVRLAR